MEKVVTKQRNVEIDVFRSFGIILMVMGHIGFGGGFDKFIHAFHMPMFFFVTGMFFRMPTKGHLKIFVASRVKALLIPYFLVGIIHYIILVCSAGINIEPLFNLFWMNTDGLPIAGALWFLTSLFIAELILYVIVCFIDYEAIRSLFVVVISLIGCVFTRVFPFRLPWAADTALVGVGVMYIGFLYSKYKNKSKVSHFVHMKPAEFIVFTCVTVCSILLNGYINMRSGEYGIIFLFWINCVAAILVGINFARIMVEVLPKGLIRALSQIGENSIVYLSFNQLIIVVVSDWFEKLSIHKIPRQFGKTIIVMAILYFIQIFIMNTKLKWFMGKTTRTK